MAALCTLVMASLSTGIPVAVFIFLFITADLQGSPREVNDCQGHASETQAWVCVMGLFFRVVLKFRAEYT